MTYAYWDEYGEFSLRVEPESLKGMLCPVRCNLCNEVYDLTKGEPIARYADCTVYKTPCCGRTVDDRPGIGGGGRSAFVRLDRFGREQR